MDPTDNLKQINKNPANVRPNLVPREAHFLRSSGNAKLSPNGVSMANPSAKIARCGKRFGSKHSSPATIMHHL